MKATWGLSPEYQIRLAEGMLLSLTLASYCSLSSVQSVSFYNVISSGLSQSTVQTPKLLMLPSLTQNSPVIDGILRSPSEWRVYLSVGSELILTGHSQPLEFMPFTSEDSTSCMTIFSPRL